MLREELITFKDPRAGCIAAKLRSDFIMQLNQRNDCDVCLLYHLHI
jgi:hypothetical protein